MKKVLLSAILFLGLSPAHAWNNSVAESSGGIGEARSFVDVSLKNRVNSPIICRDVTVDIAYENQGQMIIARKQYNMGRVYIEQHESKAWQVGADEHQRLAEKNEYVFVRDFEVTVGSCERVQFTDYCNFAEKNKDELYTLQRVMAAVKAGRCEDVEGYLQKAKGRLKLSGIGISSLQPISFLTQLRELDLSNNYISSVELLANLSQLTKLDVSDNGALKEIDAVIALPNIESIDASSTGLAYKNWQKKSPRLKKLNIKNTPFESTYNQIRKSRLK